MTADNVPVDPMIPVPATEEPAGYRRRAGQSVSQTLTPGGGPARANKVVIGDQAVNQEVLIERFFQTLISGDRVGARAIVKETIEAGVPAERLMIGLFWPTLQMIEKLHRADQISRLAHHFATRLMRALVEQTQLRLETVGRNGRRVFIACGGTELDELAAVMAADLVEAGGFDVQFCGGGVASDEILGRVGEDQPDVLLLFSSAASDLPGIRGLIDELNSHQAAPNMQIVVGGGVYSRAEGLADEIGADLWIPDLEDLVDLLIHQSDKRATASQRTVGRKRRSKTAA